MRARLTALLVSTVALSCAAEEPEVTSGCGDNVDCLNGSVCDNLGGQCLVEDGQLFAGSFRCVPGAGAGGQSTVVGTFGETGGRIPFSFGAACVLDDDGTLDVSLYAFAFDGFPDSFGVLQSNVPSTGSGIYEVGLDPGNANVLYLYQQDESVDLDAVAGALEGYVILYGNATSGQVLDGYVAVRLLPFSTGDGQ